MAHSSISGIKNNKYDWNFISWLFGFLDGSEVNNVLHVGADNGYLSSLLLLRQFYINFHYLAIDSGKELPLYMVDRNNESFFLGEINRVESVMVAARFILGSTGKCLLICEEMMFGPLFYYPLLRPGDIMITDGYTNRVGMDVTDLLGNWKICTK